MAHLEDQANEKMVQELDNSKYVASHLISIKVPLTFLPYYTNSAEYLRQDGRIEIGGVIYNYVKARIYNDSLEVLCIPNAEATKLLTAKNDFLKFSNDQQRGGQGKKPVPAGKSFKYFSPGNCQAKNPAKRLAFLASLSKLNRAYLILPFYYVTVIEEPPDV
jgi:hypothetical protein